MTIIVLDRSSELIETRPVVTIEIISLLVVAAPYPPRRSKASPGWERACRKERQNRLGEGYCLNERRSRRDTPHPIVLADRPEMPSPARGEGAVSHRVTLASLPRFRGASKAVSRTAVAYLPSISELAVPMVDIARDAVRHAPLPTT